MPWYSTAVLAGSAWSWLRYGNLNLQVVDPVGGVCVESCRSQSRAIAVVRSSLLPSFLTSSSLHKTSIRTPRNTMTTEMAHHSWPPGLQFERPKCYQVGIESAKRKSRNWMRLRPECHQVGSSLSLWSTSSLSSHLLCDSHSMEVKDTTSSNSSFLARGTTYQCSPRHCFLPNKVRKLLCRPFLSIQLVGLITGTSNSASQPGKYTLTLNSSSATSATTLDSSLRHSAFGILQIGTSIHYLEIPSYM